MNSMSLTTWQTVEKPRSELFYNCSEFDRMNDEWIPFSIGLGWSIIQNPTPLKDLQVGPHEELVLCAINAGTDQRRRGFNVLPHYKFIISPEGNGIDCHRHYEALMAGCIPIIEEHEGIRGKYKGCPVLYTKDYSEITPAYLEQKYTEMVNETYDFSRLLMSSYSAEEQAQIRANGNYWSNRLSGKYWYP